MKRPPTATQPRPSSVLRRLLEQPGCLVVPCAYDCVSARLVEMAGFPAVMHGGYNVSASLLGMPDTGLISMTEMMAAARNMAAAVDIPLVCDVDDGFGGPLNVTRVTREAIRGGLAGLYIDDQVMPKRCPALGGGRVVSTEDMRIRLQAVRRARTELDPGFVIIARVHASRALSFEEGIERGIAYAQEDADLIWVDLGYDDTVLQELEMIVDRIGPHAPVIANMTENVGRPMLTTDELHGMGFKMVVYPLTLLMTAAKSMSEALAELASKGTTRAAAGRMLPPAAFRAIVKMDEVHALEEELS